jgi:hypothetical protein
MCSNGPAFQTVSTLSRDNVVCVSRDVPFWNKRVWTNQAAEWVVMVFTAQIHCSFHFGLVLSQSSWPVPVLSPLGHLVLPVYSSFMHGSQGTVLFPSFNVFSGSFINHILVSFVGSSSSWYCWLRQHKFSKDPLQSFSYVIHFTRIAHSKFFPLLTWCTKSGVYG